MYKVLPILFLVLVACSLPAQTNDNRAKIKDYLDHEIQIIDRFAGQSITLIKEKQDYYICFLHFKTIPLFHFKSIPLSMQG